MADELLPDIPADVFNNWSADQFASAAGDKIATIRDDISQGVQNALAPPLPPPPPAPPPPAPTPTPLPAPAAPVTAPLVPPGTVPPGTGGPVPANAQDLLGAGWQVVQGAQQAVQQAPANLQDL